MGYLGREPQIGFTETVKDSFNGDNSTTAFTMSQSVSLDTDIEVFVGNVQQEPGSGKAYVVSGTTLTFSEAPPTGTANIYVIHRNSLQGTLFPPQNLGDKNYLIGGNLSLDADSAALKFGADSDITLTHSADTGLILKNTSTTGNSGIGAVLTLQTGDTDIAQTDTLGRIDFQAPDEGTGTDAILVAASIRAIAVNNFSSSANPTSLEFMTGSSEAATRKMAVTSGGNVNIFTDGASIQFGADSEINLKHVADTGLILKHTATADDKPVVLTLQTGETDIAQNDILGKIQFQAPDEGTGTDAILVAAGIQAISEGDFSSSSNATTLQFLTGASEAASAKMSLTSGGDVNVLTDGASIFFGADSEIELRHVADDGLILKHVGTGDGKEPSFTFQAGDNDIAQDDVLGQINFQAPDEGAGTDAILVAASIKAFSEGDFSASNNATTLEFATGRSAAAGSDGGRLRLTSNGTLFLKSQNTADDSKPVIHLQAGDTDIAQDDELGAISFSAPDEGAGTDAILTAAQIMAVSEGDFSSSSNATSLAFKTASSEAAAEKMRLTSAGRLGIGVTDPDQLLELNDQESSVDVGIHFAGNGVDHSMGIDGSNGGYLTISNSATIGTNPYFTLGPSTRIFAGAASIHTSVAGGGISIKPTSDATQLMLEQENGSNGAEGWLFHASSAGGPLTFSRRTGSSDTAHFRISNGGVLTGTDTDGIGSISDERLKKDVVDFTYSLEDFKKFKPRKFNWKTPELHNSETNTIGFIAQELETVDSRFVYDTTYVDVKDSDEYKALETKVTNKSASEDEETLYNDMKLQSEQNKNNLDKQYLDADGIAKASKLLKKDAMYISTIQQLITKIETLETKVKALEDA